MSEPDSSAGDVMQDSLIINEVQLLLSEKRTSLSMLRTGIAIFHKARSNGSPSPGAAGEASAKK